ncbi:hypothetical protein D3C73_1318940 [compost metagenome]
MQALSLAQGFTQDASIQMIEAVGIDPVGVGQIFPGLQLMLLHAGLLDEVISLFVRRAVQWLDDLLGHQLAEAL